MTKKQLIGLTPKLSGLGGMVTFQNKFRSELSKQGIESSFELLTQPITSLLVVGGTRKLSLLSQIQKKNIRIVHRLDGINWLHRKTRTGLRHWLRAEVGNRLLQSIRKNYADHIVYQSQFVLDWWRKEYGELKRPHSVIHNGVDLDLFTPKGGESRPKNKVRILMVEGNISGGYEIGLETAIALANQLARNLDRPVELAIAANVSPGIKKKTEEDSQVHIDWLGVLDNHDLPAQYRSAHALFSADLNAACPNSVLEALACGLPVVAFNTGALPELLSEASGRLVDYGGDPWNLDAPDISSLASAAGEVFHAQEQFREGARARAEEAFDIVKMTESYLTILDDPIA